MPEEEARRALDLEPWNAAVRPGIRVERLLGGTEGVEEFQGRLARHQLVVPLHQELERDRTRAALTGTISRLTRPMTAALIRESAATNGRPIAAPSETPQ